ncbi:MAG TPA: TIGR04190 family B12-binding domain/radical SAM domain protein [Dehalococcoidia bacterium]|nr:TIGR04190 family B12-binding domain/radical SAM domain protein [Dehalococcoidia bacterium]
MPHTDLVLLHPPSVYDFRQKTILFGPTSDLIPSSPIFELYPIGFTSIAEYLERAGYRVRIVNLAVRMLLSPKFDAEKLVKSLNATVFGIDLHWLLHAHGAIEISRMVKRHHPEAKLILGGLSASYYHRELLDYPEIDYVLRGDSTEEPFRQLMECIIGNREPTAVPNLSWRDNGGEVHHNPLSHVPDDLSDVFVNHYDHTVRSVVRYRDLSSYLPYRRWLRYPITAVLTCRGCTHNCLICGGSAAAFRQCYNRERPAFRTPEAVVHDVKRIGRLSNGPIFILGDILQAGEDYAYQLLELLSRERAKNQLILELFGPAPPELLKKMGEACPGFCLEISPESHDPEIRKACGRDYSTDALEATVESALAAGCSRMDIFFMFGLPRQTPQSVMDTVDYCGHLMDKFRDKRVFTFTAPLAPFLDPGSLAFENPERYGYRLLMRSLEEHRQALEAPSWKYHLNYETEWMSREQLVTSAYRAELELNSLKARYGIISKGMAEATAQRLYTAREMLDRIDEIVDSGREEQLAQIKGTVDLVNMSRAGGKRELELPTTPIKIRLPSTVWSLIRGW